MSNDAIEKEIKQNKWQHLLTFQARNLSRQTRNIIYEKNMNPNFCKMKYRMMKLEKQLH
jgi:hypothetical protein